ncbi:MAG: response regulator [Gammaproteobacteria bacterium]|nr:response regulator [Gammaproteobacteria bacterium]
MAKKVLIVEDNEQNMILENDILEIAGFEVLQAVNATAGIELAIKEKPAVIVMDVRLPDMRGTEAVKVLRKNKETCDIPVIFVTASVMAEGLEEVKATPNSSYISKPINTRTFAEEVGKSIK